MSSVLYGLKISWRFDQKEWTFVSPVIRAIATFFGG
uniref:Uncharacterized protein n=1 Tax=Anguilla anguilla TaxID=7936 RepID=A0A0E9TFC6_ANGAN